MYRSVEPFSNSVKPLKNFSDSLYTTNKNVYQLLRYGVKVKADASSDFEDVELINWSAFSDNDFAIAEEVTIKGNKTKRPDRLDILIGNIKAIAFTAHCRPRTCGRQRATS